MARPDCGADSFHLRLFTFPECKACQARGDDGVIDVSLPPGPPAPPLPPLSAFPSCLRHPAGVDGALGRQDGAQRRPSPSGGEPLHRWVSRCRRRSSAGRVATYSGKLWICLVRSSDNKLVGTVSERGGDDPSECQSQTNNSVN